MCLKRVVYGLWLFSFLGIALLLSACVPAPPDHPENVCLIYGQYPDWHWDADKAYRRWGIPEPVLMAVIDHESSFNGRAKPPRRHLLWIIPWKRISTAKGYSQALNGTWEQYENSVHHDGNRTKFSDSADFIGWYAYEARQVDHISPYDPYSFYLAYHEGLGGYLHRSYANKTWLIYVAKKVAYTSNRYHYQLMQCASRLPQPGWHW